MDFFLWSGECVVFGFFLLHVFSAELSVGYPYLGVLCSGCFRFVLSTHRRNKSENVSRSSSRVRQSSWWFQTTRRLAGSLAIGSEASSYRGSLLNWSQAMLYTNSLQTFNKVFYVHPDMKWAVTCSHVLNMFQNLTVIVTKKSENVEIDALTSRRHVSFWAWSTQSCTVMVIPSRLTGASLMMTFFWS